MKESERLIIIPDVHGRDFWRETVEINAGEEYIFLGDYLDPYDDEGITDAVAFGGLQDIIRFKQLKGNTRAAFKDQHQNKEDRERACDHIMSPI